IYRRRELRQMIGAAGTTVLVTPSVYRGFDHAAMAADLTAEFPGLITMTITDPTVEPDAFDTLLAAWPQAPDRPDRDAGEISELLFSSGTEATPKAIMHTEQTASFAVRTAGASLGVGEDDVVWMPSPIGHSTGFNFGVRMALEHGLPLVLQDRWDPQVAAELVRAEGCTYTVAATTFLTDLVRHCETHGIELTTLRLFGSGGAPVPAELVTAAQARGITVLRLYGSTEMLVASWNRPESSFRKRRDTDGNALDGVEIEIRDAQDLPVLGATGEIVVRGPACSVGFLGDPERTARTYGADGWVRSGDLGVLDAEGYLTIVGRLKEIIIRGGMNVAPREVEEMIGALPGIAAVAVVGIPDERLGEIGCACVVLEPDAVVTLPWLVAQLKSAGLAGYKLPEMLAVMSELPSTPSGKVQKHRLRVALSDPRATDRTLIVRVDDGRHRS
ncbi:MAG: AMP-binding protein, partial [Actinomycetes bacterium]